MPPHDMDLADQVFMANPLVLVAAAGHPLAGRRPKLGLAVGIVALPLALAFGVATGVCAAPGLVTAVVAGAVAAILLTAMLVTPLLHHAAAVLVMGPVAATVATNLHYNVDPFLMAVALGACSDFLTPIGHQNNMLVMGPGGYRFGDYWKMGLPLSIMVTVVGTALIMMAWPL